MEHSKNFSKVKKFYDSNLWSIERVKNAVKATWITLDEFFEITGKEFAEV